jgi:hypothetical protein
VGNGEYKRQGIVGWCLLDVMRFCLLTSLCSILLSGCVKTIDGAGLGNARVHSQRVMDSLHSGHVEEYFSENYFDRKGMAQVIAQFEGNCSPKSRQGKFLTQSYVENPQGPDFAVFRYRYEYDCHAFIFRLTYQIDGSNIELRGFYFEDGGDAVEPPDTTVHPKR